MGLFATGVTVVAAQHGKDVHAMTANAVTSVSLDPLLVLVCIARPARMMRVIEQAGGFSVNILSEDQEVLSRYFAGAWKAARPEFRFVPWAGGPRLMGALASVGCTAERTVPGGDHWIVLGRVVAVQDGDPAARPLLFFGGAYRRLTEREVAAAPDLWTEQAVQIYHDEWTQPAPPPPPEDR